MRGSDHAITVQRAEGSYLNNQVTTTDESPRTRLIMTCYYQKMLLLERTYSNEAGRVAEGGEPAQTRSAVMAFCQPEYTSMGVSLYLTKQCIPRVVSFN